MMRKIQNREKTGGLFLNHDPVRDAAFAKAMHARLDDRRLAHWLIKADCAIGEVAVEPDEFSTEMLDLL